MHINKALIEAEGLLLWIVVNGASARLLEVMVAK